MIKTLHAGERFISSDYNTFSVNKRGNVEIYAVGGSRREFLIERGRRRCALIQFVILLF